MKLWHSLSLLLMIIGFGVWGFIHWLAQDDELVQQARDKIKPDLAYQVDLKLHPYFLTLGLNAKDEIDPIALGRYRYHREWANFLHDPHAEGGAQIDRGLDASLQRPVLKAQDRELLKEFQSVLSEPKYLDAFLLEHKIHLQDLIESERIPLTRLAQLIQQEDYTSLVMHPQAVYPNYADVMDLQRLSLANQLLNQSDIRSYHAQFQQLNCFTQNRLSIVEKMLMQNWMSRLIDLMREAQKMQPKQLHLETLIPDQLSLESSLQHELGAQYAYLQALPKSFPQGEQASRWVFLPNRTFSRVAEKYQHYFDLSKYSYRDLTKQFSRQLPVSSQGWVVKNYYGEMIARIEVPRFEKYLLMTHILNNKILAFNAVNVDQLNLAELNRNAAGRHYYVKGGQLCIEIPYPIEKLPQLNLKTDSCVAI